MVKLDSMQGLIAGYVTSPKGQAAIRNYLTSPEGKKTLDAYLSTPDGQEMARLVLSRVLEGTTLSADARAQVFAAVEEKKETGLVNRPGEGANNPRVLPFINDSSQLSRSSSLGMGISDHPPFSR
jgi:hypothetical protein